MPLLILAKLSFTSVQMNTFHVSTFTHCAESLVSSLNDTKCQFELRVSAAALSRLLSLICFVPEGNETHSHKLQR